jgi:hypothetical protein
MLKYAEFTITYTIDNVVEHARCRIIGKTMNQAIRRLTDIYDKKEKLLEGESVGFYQEKKVEDLNG